MLSSIANVYEKCLLKTDHSCQSANINTSSSEQRCQADERKPMRLLIASLLLTSIALGTSQAAFAGKGGGNDGLTQQQLNLLILQNKGVYPDATPSPFVPPATGGGGPKPPPP
jgi:hypothetical protein